MDDCIDGGRRPFGIGDRLKLKHEFFPPRVACVLIRIKSGRQSVLSGINGCPRPLPYNLRMNTAIPS